MRTVVRIIATIRSFYRFILLRVLKHIINYVVSKQKILISIMLEIYFVLFIKT